MEQTPPIQKDTKPQLKRNSKTGGAALLMNPSDSSYSPLRTPVSLTNCDREPVAYICRTQPHGVLLVVDPHSLIILQHSSNAQTFFRSNSKNLLGTTVTSLTEWDLSDELRSLPARNTKRFYKTSLDLQLEVAYHRRDNLLILEFERERKETADSTYFSALRSLLPRLSSMDSVKDYSQTLAECLRPFLETQRVMVYEFLPDWTGVIIAESCASEVETRFLNLRFPSSDIPAPARKLLLEDWARHIRQVSATPEDLVPGTIDGHEMGTDLGKALLRASSPIHIEYLQNMGIEGSLTCPLRVKNRLWGLIACHNDAELEFSQEKRAALEMFLELASVRLEELLGRISSKSQQLTLEILGSVERDLLQYPMLRLNLQLDQLKNLMKCDGCVIYQDGHWWSTDEKLLDAQLHELRDAILSLPLSEDGVRSSELLEWSGSHRYPGVLSPDLNLGEEVGLFWLRSPDTYVIEWAGDPRKSELGGEGRLNPRFSFESYVETVEGKSNQWSENDMRAALACRSTLERIQLSLTSMQRLQAEVMQTSNRELQAFAYMASHDLKEPIRGIHTSIEFLREDYAEVLGEDGNELLDLATTLTTRMNTLLTDLLEYARVDSKKLLMEAVPMEEVARDVLLLLDPRGERVTLESPLSRVHVYPAFLSEVLNNLVRNALKYSRKKDGMIQIGEQKAEAGKGYKTFYVRDQGIGIAPEFHDVVFKLFRRLHDVDEYEGSGVGLTIARKMIERHGGNLWIESSEGEGCTFFFTLPAA